MSGEAEWTGDPAGATGSDRGGDVPPPGNLLVRLARVFVAPGELFERLRERPVWLDALLLLVVLSLLATLLVPRELMIEAMQAGLGPEADPEAGEAIAEFAESGLFTVFRVGTAVLFPPLVTLAIAALLGFVYNLVLGGTASFRQLYSVTVHGYLVAQVGALVMVPVLVATGDPNSRLALHLLVPGLDPEGYPHRLLSGLDVFGLWTAVVLGIGVGRLYPKRSVRAAVVGLLSALVVLRAVAALVGG